MRAAWPGVEAHEEVVIAEARMEDFDRRLPSATMRGPFRRYDPDACYVVDWRDRVASQHNAAMERYDTYLRWRRAGGNTDELDEAWRRFRQQGISTRGVRRMARQILVRRLILQLRRRVVFAHPAEQVWARFVDEGTQRLLMAICGGMDA